MLDWLRLLSMVFYAPMRGMREVRDRAALAPSGLVALIVHWVFLLLLAWSHLRNIINFRNPLTLLLILFNSAGALLFIALVFVPLAVFLVNLLERRASFRLVMQQEYSAVASTLFYGWAAASLIALVLNLAGKTSGVLQVVGNRMFESFLVQRDQFPPELLVRLDQRLLSPEFFAIGALLMVMIMVFGVWATIALQTVFRTPWLRSGFIVLVSGIVLLPAGMVLLPIFSAILGSPFLLLILFLLLRGYIGEVTRTQRARAAFKQNLEAATLNPADSSAHYNLGLIHQERGEFDAARERFERTVQIDADEIDAHYQLGRISRQQKRFADTIRHFEQVVSRNRSHSQYEVWREVGATYVAAGQYEDARMALERFLEQRPSDPQGLYLMGRAHAGLGHQHEAASSMEACIQAVKTAPAYKYRAEKRWLNEAQQFLRSQAM
jgi:tetratricopeptide (TPR) repeat protein